MSLVGEFRSGNFSLYGQWFGLFSVIALAVIGGISFAVLWSILAWIIAFLLVFVEIPLCLKCCPTSPKFDNFLIKFQNPIFRAIGYVVFAVIMWLAVANGVILHVIGALLLTGAALSYSVAALRHQTYASSTITGGTGVSTIV